jgi:hypothetical protein
MYPGHWFPRSLCFHTVFLLWKNDQPAFLSMLSRSSCRIGATEMYRNVRRLVIEQFAVGKLPIYIFIDDSPLKNGAFPVRKL